MKFIFIFLLMMNVVYADGGQSGSGGNGCWIKDGHQMMWISIEELSYPEHINPGERSNLKIELPFASSLSPLVFNLWTKFNGENPFRRFERIKRTAPKTFGLLQSLSRLFEVSFVVNNTIEGHFNADMSRAYSGCLSFSPSLMTFPDGTIVFFKKAWDRMDSLSAEIILIHETIRLGQLLHPVFKNMSNKELQFLTALFFSEGFYLHQAVRKIERSVHLQEDPELWSQQLNWERQKPGRILESKKKIRSLW